MQQTFHLVKYGGFSYLDINLMPTNERVILYKALVEELKKDASAIDPRTIQNYGL